MTDLSRHLSHTLDDLTDAQRKLLLRVSLRKGIYVRGASKRVARALIDDGLLYVHRVSVMDPSIYVRTTPAGEAMLDGSLPDRAQ